MTAVEQYESHRREILALVIAISSHVGQLRPEPIDRVHVSDLSIVRRRLVEVVLALPGGPVNGGYRGIFNIEFALRSGNVEKMVAALAEVLK